MLDALTPNPTSFSYYREKMCVWAFGWHWEILVGQIRRHSVIREAPNAAVCLIERRHGMIRAI